MVIRWLRRRVCRHVHTLRERDPSGRYWLVCDCGHRAEALTRTDQERAKTATFPAVAMPTARTVPRPLGGVASGRFRRRP
jgi:hypothetical protein